MFRDQDFYTSEIELKFLMKNPIFNIWYIDESTLTEEEKEIYIYENLFHIKTFTVDDKRDFPDLLTSSYSDEAVQAMIETVKTDYSKYLYAIDASIKDKNIF